MIELLAITTIFAAILIKQPDFGTTMVMVAVVLGMMYMAGVNAKRFSFFFLAVIGLMTPSLSLRPTASNACSPSSTPGNTNTTKATSW